MSKSKSMIKTKSVYDSAESSDGTRVLVTRFHPRKKGFKKGISYDIWLKGLSPPKEILMAYRKGEITRDKFKEMYLEHLHANEEQEEGDEDRETEVGRALKELRKILLHRGGGDKNNAIITLLCYEPEDGKTFCHRHVLKYYLFENKKKV